jgi:NADH-quinone oxidoreductase subunit E
MLHIAARTGVAPAKIYGVATFYTQFRLKPVGKYIVMLCAGTACHVNGAAEIEEAVSEHLSVTNGETTADELFTLNVVACLGCCSLAPVMMIKGPDGEETFGNLTKASAVKILDGIAAGNEVAS